MTHQAEIRGAPAGRTAFAVPGVHCAGCISKIESGLAAEPGILSARVNFTARQLVVEHLPELTIPALQDAIARTGFQAQPLTASADAQGAESRALLRATAVAGFAAMNIMLLSVSVWSGAAGATRDLFHLLSALIAIPAIAYSGRPFFRSAWGALRHRRTNMDVPISIGVLLVTGLSLFETLTSGPHAYFDGAVMLIFFLLCGRVLDSVMRDRARDGVAALLKQRAIGATVLLDGGRSEWRAAEALTPGLLLSVAAGERLAADGVVESGASSIDRALITGESAPQRVASGDKVLAGTLNLDSPLTIRVSAAGADTALADIARLMEQAGQGRSRYVRIADRAARLYAPAVHTLAALSFLGWLAVGAGWHQAMLIAAAVLIITCPCALGLAVPAAQIVVAGALMRRGVLVKDGSALERLAETDHALFDKTGTLTLGRPEPIGLDAIPEDALPVLAALSARSRHPLSRGIFHALAEVPQARLEQVREIAGSGLTAIWAGSAVSLGRADQGSGTASRFRIGERGWTIRFEDRLRPDAAATLDRLGRIGIASEIVSGDRIGAVAPIARSLGIEGRGDLQPKDKLAAIAALASVGHKVLMVGDGLNDGPALAAGHVSMAPASASDVGQNAADAVFLGDSIAPVAIAVAAARRTMRVVRQNFAIAIAYNAIAVPLALLGLVTPLVAAAAMSGSSIIVVANALRLRNAAR